MILFKMIQEENFKTLCDLTTSLVGLHKGSLSHKSREQKYQIPRTVAAVVARMVDDTHQTIIAKELKRDRSLVYHYEKTHQANYRSFPKYREVFNKVYNAYSNIQGSKRTFADLAQLKNYLKDCGVTNSEKHQTTIRITSGRVQADIKLSYRDFYNQLEKCKLALTDCNYNLEII
jgi:phosphoribosylformylglycinamidine (FGAM) synthase-like enzyme